MATQPMFGDQVAQTSTQQPSGIGNMVATSTAPPPGFGAPTQQPSGIGNMVATSTAPPPSFGAQPGMGMMGGPSPTQPVNEQVKMDPGFGSVQDVSNAWMGRLQPQMDQARQAEMARLRSQGITENSEAWGRAMDTLNRNDVDARNQALIQGTSAYNDIFNRQLAQNNQVYGQGMGNKQFGLQQQNQGWNQGFQQQQADRAQSQFNKNFGLQQQNQDWSQWFNNRGQAFNQDLQGAQFANQSNQQQWNQNYGQQQLALQLRQQQAQEALQSGNLTIAQRQQMMAEANNPYQQMMWMNSMQYNPQFGGFTNQGAGQGTNFTGAGQNQYLGNLGNYNAKTAANNGMISGIGQLFGGLMNQGSNPQGGGGQQQGLWGMLSGLGPDFLKALGIGGP